MDTGGSIDRSIDPSVCSFMQAPLMQGWCGGAMDAGERQMFSCPCCLCIQVSSDPNRYRAKDFFFFPPTRLIVFVVGRERRKPCALPRRLFLFYDRCFNRSRSPSSVTAPMAVIGGGERRSGGVSTAAELRTGKTYALCSSPPPPKQMPVCVHYYYACTHAPSGDGTGWSE